MSQSADHVVVSFSAFLERRKQLAAIAATLRQPEGDDPARPAAPEKKASAKHSLTQPSSRLPSALAARAPR
jgi:hypothetical protein